MHRALPPARQRNELMRRKQARTVLAVQGPPGAQTLNRHTGRCIMSNCDETQEGKNTGGNREEGLTWVDVRIDVIED